MKRTAEFYNSLAGFNNLNGGEDRLECNKDRKFSINPAYKELNSAAVKERNCPWKMIWKPKIPYKVNCSPGFWLKRQP